MPASHQDILFMAATIWGEARGEAYAGKLAVGHVILNRLRKPGWWSRQGGDGIPDDTVAAVCIDPMQFSCWNKDDANSKRVQAIAVNGPMLKMGDYDYRQCLRAAMEVIDVVADDPTKGSTHYHVSGMLPAWALRKAPAAVIGRHLFYNNIS